VPAASMTWRRVSDLPFQTLEEDTVVLDPSRHEVHLLNGSATRVWQLCTSPRTIEDLLAAMGEEYDVPADELRAAMTTLLDSLVEKCLLVSS
jgi:hypothetical protein